MSALEADAEACRSRTLSASQLPVCFADLATPPQALFIRGQLPPGPYVGVVGTRSPTPEAERFAHQCCRLLALRGVTIVSGGARGIDAAAHRGAMAGKGRTVVVAPCSFEFPYPPEHAELFQRVVAQGCFLSEHSRAVKACPARFFRRNSLLVALCQVLIVIEAPLRSGARNAAQWARRLGRPLLVVPGVPWNPKARGTLEELRLGALPLVGVNDVLALLPEGAQRLAQVRTPFRSPALQARGPEDSEFGDETGAGQQLSWWQGPTESAPSAAEPEPSVQETSASEGAFASGSPTSPRRTSACSEPALRARILQALRGTALSADGLLEYVGVGPETLHQALLQLQLSARVERDAMGRYQLKGWEAADRAR